MFSEWLVRQLDFDQGLASFSVPEWKVSLKKFGPRGQFSAAVTQADIVKSFYSGYATKYGDVTCSFDKSERCISFSPSQCWGSPSISLTIGPKSKWLLEEDITLKHKHATCTLRAAQTKKAVSFWANTEQKLTAFGWNCSCSCLWAPSWAASVRLSRPGFSLTTAAKQNSVLLRTELKPELPFNIRPFGELEVVKWELSKLAAGVVASIEGLALGAIIDFMTRHHQERLYIETDIFNVAIGLTYADRLFLEYGVSTNLPDRDLMLALHYNTNNRIGLDSSVSFNDNLTLSLGCEMKLERAPAPICQFSVLLTD